MNILQMMGSCRDGFERTRDASGMPCLTTAGKPYAAQNQAADPQAGQTVSGPR